MRREKIKELLPRGKTHAEIATTCGVSVKTIDRDVAAWKISGGMEEWLQEEFFRQYQFNKVERPTLALSIIANLLGKTLTHRVEARTEGKQTIVVKVWKPDAEPADGDSNKILP
jgi:IS30 family transposase